MRNDPVENYWTEYDARARRVAVALRDLVSYVFLPSEVESVVARLMDKVEEQTA